MRNLVSRARTVAGIIALATAALAVGVAPSAHAGGDAVRPTSAIVETQHHSILRIRSGDPLPQTRSIIVGRNKSMLVELPRELRDVVVSNPSIMDAVLQSSNRVYLIGKRTGQSNAFFFDANGQQILTLEVLVEIDTAPLEQLLHRLLPGSSIRAEVLNDTIILTGGVRNPIDSNRAADIASRFVVSPSPENDDRHRQKVINMLAVEGEEQVMLRVTVAEVQRSALKQMGVNLGALVTSGQFSTYFLTENALPLTAALGLGGLPVMAVPTVGASAGNVQAFNTGPAEGVFGNSGTQSFWGTGNNQLAFAIRALERDGLVRTLAEPNLTATSGETAKFLAGGEFPIPVVDTQGQLSVTFKEFGVGLAFTPIVMSEGRINLKIETEVSELTNAGAVTLSNIQIPALKKRQAKSTVELPSGGSIAMAGLISDDVRQNLDGFPGLREVPILGTLFRSRDFVRQETELVVIVTPYTVRPTARRNLARPDDGLAPATDRYANFLGHLNRIYGGGGPLPDGGLKGDYGFIVE